VFEIIDFAIDLFKRNGVKEAIQPQLCSFLLCIKGYCLMPYNSVSDDIIVIIILDSDVEE
jgi:hypothetical protein